MLSRSLIGRAQGGFLSEQVPYDPQKPHEHTAPKMGSTCRIHQHMYSPKKRVRLQNAYNTAQHPKGGQSLPKGRLPLDSSSKWSPPLHFINQMGSASRFHYHTSPKTGDSPLLFININPKSGPPLGTISMGLIGSLFGSKIRESGDFVRSHLL